MDRISEISLVRSEDTSYFHSAYEVRSLGRLVFDKLFAASVLLFLSPFLVPVAVLIWFSQGWPIFFEHKRVGLNGREFGCLKFRTMVVDAEEKLATHLASNPIARAQWDAARKLDDDPRITGGERCIR